MSRLIAFFVLLAGSPAAAGGAFDELRALGGPRAAQAEPPAPAAPRPPRTEGVYFCAMGADGLRQAGTIRSAALGRLFSLLDGGSSSSSPLRISDAGVSREARLRARALTAEMFAQTPAFVGRGLRRSAAFLVVIPRDRKLTDMPAFAALRGVRLPDGRIWDDVRGVGLVSQDDGSVAVGVGEENLLAGAADGYPKGYLIAHEISHAVHAYGLNHAAQSELEGRFLDRSQGGLPFSSRYAGTNAYEYFAVGAAGFFEAVLAGSDPERDFAWLRQNDAWLTSFLISVYGRSRPLWPTPSPRPTSK